MDFSFRHKIWNELSDIESYCVWASVCVCFHQHTGRVMRQCSSVGVVVPVVSACCMLPLLATFLLSATATGQPSVFGGEKRSRVRKSPL